LSPGVERPMNKLIWEDEDGEIKIDEEKMLKWFNHAIENLRVLKIEKAESAWILFLMGAEAAVRGNDEKEGKLQ
jgi:hypothetical protein